MTDKPSYGEWVATIRAVIIDNINELGKEGDNFEDYKAEIEKVLQAETLGELANVARDMAWDFWSFNKQVWKAFGEPEGTALYEPMSWDR